MLTIAKWEKNKDHHLEINNMAFFFTVFSMNVSLSVYIYKILRLYL